MALIRDPYQPGWLQTILGPSPCFPNPPRDEILLPSPPPSEPKKMPKYLVLKAKKNFSGAFGAGKYPYIPIFSLFIAFLSDNFRKIAKIF